MAQDGWQLITFWGTAIGLTGQTVSNLIRPIIRHFHEKCPDFPHILIAQVYFGSGWRAFAFRLDS